MASGSVRPLRSAISIASPIVNSSVSNTSLFVPRNVFSVLYFVIHYATLSTVNSELSLEPSVQKDSSPRSFVCFIAFFALFAISLMQGAMLTEKISSSTDLMFLVSVVVSMVVPSEIVHASRYPSASLPLLIDLNQS